MFRTHRSRWSRWLKKTSSKAQPSRRLSFDALEERRLLTAGSLDPTFGTGGIASSSYPYVQPSSDAGKFLLTEADGHFFVGSDTTVPTTLGPVGNPVTNFAITEYNSDGSIDTSFGTDGSVDVQSEIVTSMAFGFGGQVLVAGYGGGGINGPEFVIQSYSVSGSLNSAFGNGTGVIETPVDQEGQISAITVEPDGSIIAVGLAGDGTGTQFKSYLAAVKYNADGSLDTSFGTGGIADGIRK